MAIAANPRNVRILSHYAWFLFQDLHKFDKAEKYYLKVPLTFLCASPLSPIIQKTLAADPNHTRTLTDYAIFLWRVRNNYVQAEELFLRSISLCETAQAIGGYAKFLESIGRSEEAR